MLRKTRRRWTPQIGDYYLGDLDRNAIIGENMDPKALALELGVLGSIEQVIE